MYHSVPKMKILLIRWILKIVYYSYTNFLEIPFFKKITFRTHCRNSTVRTFLIKKAPNISVFFHSRTKWGRSTILKKKSSKSVKKILKCRQKWPIFFLTFFEFKNCPQWNVAGPDVQRDTQIRPSYFRNLIRFMSGHAYRDFLLLFAWPCLIMMINFDRW